MKNIKIYLLLFLLLATVTACSKNNSGNSTTGQNDPANQGFHRPDFGQPESQADVMGLVKSVIGNEIVVIKV